MMKQIKILETKTMSPGGELLKLASKATGYEQSAIEVIVSLYNQ